MGQPTPPGDNIPLIEGLDPSWNDIVNYIPEDKRGEFAPLLKQRVESYEPLKAYEDYAKSGITKEHLDTALNVFSTIENNPRQVYDAIATHLNITPAQAKEVVEELEEADEEDPRIKTMQDQINTLVQLELAKNQMSTQEKQQAEAEASIDRDINALKKKYSDVDEEEIVMRMLHQDMTAEQAYQSYSAKVSELRKTRPAPMLMGGGGSVPRPSIDVRKLDSAGARDLVAQMLQQANNEK